MTALEYAALLQDVKGLESALADHKRHVVDVAPMADIGRVLIECVDLEHRLQHIREQCEGHRPVA